jgi:N-acetylneuraminate synthase
MDRKASPSLEAAVAIAGRRVGLGHPPLIVAEMSGNHNQSLERALKIVEAAAASGAHALKLQTYTADTMTIDVNSEAFRITDANSLWSGYSLHRLYQVAATPWDWHKPIFERCRALGLIAFSTPFDESAVDLLEQLEAPCYKIASFENTDLALIRRVAATGKPLIISTGMATAGEIDESVRAARAAGCRSLVLLKCTSSYPASPEDSNITTIPHMRELFQCEIGLSDHTLGIGVAIAAVALGASLIEKHFTLRRADGGVDAAFSLEPAEMAALVGESERAFRALGAVSYGSRQQERGSLVFRRSLYVTEDLQCGERLTRKNLRAIRPGHGLPPKFLDVLLNKRVGRKVAKGTPMSWDLLSEEEGGEGRA